MLSEAFLELLQYLSNFKKYHQLSQTKRVIIKNLLKSHCESFIIQVYSCKCLWKKIMASYLFPFSNSPESFSHWLTLTQNHTEKEILENVVPSLRRKWQWCQGDLWANTSCTKCFASYCFGLYSWEKPALLSDTNTIFHFVCVSPPVFLLLSPTPFLDKEEKIMIFFLCF